jgi:uncharacterized protein (DUF983 family)
MLQHADRDKAVAAKHAQTDEPLLDAAASNSAGHVDGTELHSLASGGATSSAGALASAEAGTLPLELGRTTSRLTRVSLAMKSLPAMQASRRIQANMNLLAKLMATPEMIERRQWQRRARNTNTALFIVFLLVLAVGLVCGRKLGIYTASNFIGLVIFIVGIYTTGLFKLVESTSKRTQFVLAALYFNLVVLVTLIGSALTWVYLAQMNEQMNHDCTIIRQVPL